MSFKIVFLTILLIQNVISQDNSTIVDSEISAKDSASTVVCKPGNAVGYMMIRQPNMSSLVYVNTVYNISWDYTKTVTTRPTFIDFFVQLIAPGIRVTWSKEIERNVTAEPSWFLWEPKGLVDGKYKIRLVPDGKETWNIDPGKLPCFANGESIPSVSATFTVANPRNDIVDYPDRFPPNTSSRLSLSTSIATFVGIIFFLILSH